MDKQMQGAVESDGFAIRRGVLSPEEADRLSLAFPDRIHAIRNLMVAVPDVALLARSSAIRAAAGSILGPSCFAVRGLFFDKTQGANWKVAWHQDSTIAVRNRVEVAGFGPWSEKDGIPHVRPPSGILGRMLAIRIHLDPCGLENGPLRVIPGSHVEGILDAGAIARWRRDVEAKIIVAGRGDALMMRPLLLHASSAASSPEHRRVIHLEFAAEDLPEGLEWHGRW